MDLKLTENAMTLKIGVISDIHYAGEDPVGRRRGAIGDILLRKTVERLNRAIRPDITVLLGDILDEGDAPGAGRMRRELRESIDLLQSPVIVLPGNHDGKSEEFYADFPRPQPYVDIKGHRLVHFIDPEEPGYNARREEGNLERMRAARQGFQGPVIMLQHTALFPPGACGCPYNYTNIEDILDTMKDCGIRLSISGHFHDGAGPLQHEHGHGVFIISPALCREPFGFLEVDIDGADVRATAHELRMPEELELVDYHVHTPLAYCSRDMDYAKSTELARTFGLAGIAFAEHSGQLYFSADDYWSRRFLDIGLENASSEDNRMEEYLRRARCFPSLAKVGLELDNDYEGRPVVRDEDRRRVDLLLGAPHTVCELLKPEPDPEVAADQFLNVLENLASSGIHILVHPFRAFRRPGVAVPQRLFEPTVRILKKYDVAAEINYHINAPDRDFFATCLRNGVKLAFGSDSHELYEVGEFYYHLRLIGECGYDGDLSDILLDYEGIAGKS